MLRRESRHLLFEVGTDRSSARGLWWLLGVFLAGIIFAAVLSPLVYLGIVTWAEAGGPGWVVYLAEKDFPRYFDRLRWVPVIVGWFWMMRACGLWSVGKLGFGGERPRRTFLLWFLVGYVSLGAVALAQLFFPGVRYRLDESLLNLIALSLLAGVLVGLAEEILFRGVLLRAFYTAMPPLAAVFVSAAIFAGLHFKDVPEFFFREGDPVNWLSGWPVGLGTTLSPVFTADVTSFLVLTLVGVVLNLLFLRTGSLWPCIGLHAGWVALRNVWREAVRVHGDSAWWGGASLTNGWVTVVLLSVLAVWLGWWYRKELETTR